MRSVWNLNNVSALFSNFNNTNGTSNFINFKNQNLQFLQFQQVVITKNKACKQEDIENLIPKIIALCNTSLDVFITDDITGFQ